MHRDESAKVQQRTRRASPRVNVSWTVWAQNGQQQRMRFHTVDVSSRGAKLRPKGPFRIGTTLNLEFITSNGARLHVLGVVWRIDSDGIAVLFLGRIPAGLVNLGQQS